MGAISHDLAVVTADPYTPATALPPKVKPLLRGRLHQVAAFLSFPAAAALFLRAGGVRGHIAAAVYGLTLIGLYTISSSYHVHHWSRKAQLRMRRMDHAMIYVFIAGTYTPFCLLVFHGALAVSVLIAAWVMAGLGVTMQLVPRLSTGRLHNALYIVMGWLVIVGLPQLVSKLSGAQLVLLIAGGLIYTSGSIVLASRWPDPHPATFGYHEVWHTMVVAACVCHFLAVWWLVP